MPGKHRKDVDEVEQTEHELHADHDEHPAHAARDDDGESSSRFSSSQS